MSTLETVNRRWHESLAANYNAFLAALTALELARAEQAWHEFRVSLNAHLAFEDEHITPRCESLPDNAQTLITADHTILTRLSARIDTALADLQASDTPRTTLVDQLDGYLKLRNVLTHHDLRETEQIYPTLVAQLDAEKNQALGEAMQAEHDAAQKTA